MDWALIRSFRDHLNVFQLGGYIDQQVDPIDLFTDVISKILPATLAISSRGVYAAIWPVNATASDVAFTLFAGESFAHESGPETDYAAIYNQITIEYKWSAETQNFTESRTYGADVSPYAAWSAEHYGLKVAPAIRAQFVTDDEIADLIGLTYLKLAAGRRLDIVYAADPTIYADGGTTVLYLGAPVQITDPDFGFDSRLGVISQIQRQNAAMLVTVSLLEDPFL